MSDEDVVINKQLMTRIIVRLVQNSRNNVPGQKMGWEFSSMCDLCSRDERPEAEAANYVLGRG